MGVELKDGRAGIKVVIIKCGISLGGQGCRYHGIRTKAHVNFNVFVYPKRAVLRNRMKSY